MTFRIGIDFGGSKIEAAAIDAEGRFVSRIRVANPGNYDDAIAALCGLVARVEAELGAEATVGLGTPGSHSPRDGRMRNSNSQYLNGRSLLRDFQAALGRDVRIANDANCFALSEAIDGAAAGARQVFGLIVGTGCGGGLVVDGEIVAGAEGRAGEIGHIPLPWDTADDLPAPACWCGQAGCLESWISGTGFSRAFLASTGRDLPAPAIVAAARAGDDAAAAALGHYCGRLARALALLVNLFDPEMIVIGGGMSNVEEIYQRLPSLIPRHVFARSWEGRVVPARWGDSSGVRGAARLWKDGV